MAYGSNKMATAVLLDISRGMDSMSSDGRTHLERSKHILSRIILRNMFAYETDEVGIITFGPDGVEVVSGLRIPTWDVYEKAEQISLASASAAGNWAKGMIQAVNFLEDQCQGKRFKAKQLVVFSNFTWSSPSVHAKLEPLITVVNNDKLQVVIIGLDVKKESQSTSEIPAGVGELTEFVHKLETGMTMSYEEIEESVKYYTKKKKAKRLTKGVMKIGTEIALPFKWMKVSNDDTSMKFELPTTKMMSASNGEQVPSNGVAKRPEANASGVPSKKLRAEILPLSPGKPEITRMDITANFANVDLKFEQDECRKTRFGSTEVLLSYADIDAMKLKTGPPSLTFLGTVKSSKISRSMIVGSLIYVIVSDGSKRSQAQLSALIAALLKQNKYGLARRIASSNGKPSIGILYPVSDDLGKALYFLQLPLAEWVQTVPIRPLPDAVEPALDDLMNELIDKMSIEGQGRDLLPKDPNFQLRSFRVESKATNPQGCEVLPELVREILHPHPEIEEAGEAVVKKILSNFTIPPPPPPPGSEPKQEDAKMASPSKTPKKELTDAEKADIKAIEAMAMTDTEDLLAEWAKFAKKTAEKEPPRPEYNTEELLDMI